MGAGHAAPSLARWTARWGRWRVSAQRLTRLRPPALTPELLYRGFWVPPLHAEHHAAHAAHFWEKKMLLAEGAWGFQAEGAWPGGVCSAQALHALRSKDRECM